MDTKAYATAEGKRALALLKGKVKNAKLHIWENLGWHWSIRIGNLVLYPAYGNKCTKFFCLMSKDGTGGGEVFWTRNKGDTFTDPLQAIRAQLIEARRFVEQCEAAIESVEAKLL